MGQIKERWRKGALSHESVWYNVDAQLENALNALPTVRSIQASRVAEEDGFSWTVLFLDNVGDVSLLEAPAALLRGSSACCLVASSCRPRSSRPRLL